MNVYLVGGSKPANGGIKCGVFKGYEAESLDKAIALYKEEFGTAFCSYTGQAFEEFNKHSVVNGNIIDTVRYQVHNDVLYVKNQHGFTSRKIKRDEHEFTYSFKKTIVKAIDGKAGLLKHIWNASKKDSPFNMVFFDLLNRLQ